MIPLVKVPRPKRLTTARAAELTERFLANENDVVWKLAGIPKGLKAMGRNKCAYCECSVATESNYMEVEHFQNKETYKNLVVDWENLLPSCKRCNGAKGTTDTVANPMVNPRFDVPSKHLFIRAICIQEQWFAFLEAQDEDLKGKNAVELIRLNDERVTDPRNEKITTIYKTLSDLVRIWQTIQAGAGERDQQTYLLQRIEDILDLMMPDKPYAGTVAAFVTGHSYFTVLHQGLIAAGLWSSELEEKLGEIKANCLEWKN